MLKGCDLLTLAVICAPCALNMTKITDFQLKIWTVCLNRTVLSYDVIGPRKYALVI